MPDYDPDREYFRQLDQQPTGTNPTGVALSGSVEAWQCECFHWNGIHVPWCNSCGKRKPQHIEE